ncbi:hypothetical protein FRC02_011106 [Tulasnella sp. 418]|nr:hypothetical protein FRC02_011106 [Tulasnella sp. 418]
MRLSRLFPSTETLPIPVPVYRRLAEDEPNGGSQEIGLKSGQGPLARSSEHDGTLALDYTSDYELLEYVASQSTNSKPKRTKHKSAMLSVTSEETTQQSYT